MPTKRSAVLLAACLGACAGGNRPPPTAVFPLSTSWTALLSDAVVPPLATDGRRVFVSTRDGVLRAFDSTAGRLLWEVRDRAGVLTAAAGMLVLRQEDGSVWRIDPETGSARWKSRAGIAGTLPAVLDGRGIVVAGDGIAALDETDGRLLWTQPGPTPVTALPALHGGWILAGEADGSLRCRERATGRPLWSVATGSPLRAPAVVDRDGRILLGTTARRFAALDLGARGRERWRWRLGADVTSPAVVVDDKVLFASLESVLYALKRGNGHLAWRAPLPSRPLSGPLAVESAVLVACLESDILGFDSRTGRKLGGLRTPTEMRTPPILVGRRVLVGLRNPAALACLSLPPLEPQPDPSPEVEATPETAH